MIFKHHVFVQEKRDVHERDGNIMDKKGRQSSKIELGDSRAAITKETAIILSVAMLIIGFIAGVAFSVFKSHTESGGKRAVADQSLSSMFQQLEGETVKNPGNADGWTRLGNAFFDSNMYEKAIQAYEQSLAIKPNPDVLTDLGIMYRLNKEPLKAVDAFSKAMAIDANHQFSRMNKGIVLMYDLKDEKGAVKAWEELLLLNPMAMFQDGKSVDEIVKHYKDNHAKGGNSE